jgi:plastocyanin
MARPILLLASVALLGTAVLGACGDDEPTPEAGGADRTCETVTVTIPEFRFDPTPVRIHPCDEVVWTNAHDQAHTSTGTGAQDWSTGNIQPGSSSEPVAFPTAGTFSYICALHPFMRGTVEVT